MFWRCLDNGAKFKRRSLPIKRGRGQRLNAGRYHDIAIGISDLEDDAGAFHFDAALPLSNRDPFAHVFNPSARPGVQQRSYRLKLGVETMHEVRRPDEIDQVLCWRRTDDVGLIGMQNVQDTVDVANV